ncbi:MAG: GNAT family N-acetyltransferase [Chromatiaceae bacterium]|nr:GNAT family N-acetyltransferase [Chromatiaceae bacterium]
MDRNGDGDLGVAATPCGGQAAFVSPGSFDAGHTQFLTCLAYAAQFLSPDGYLFLCMDGSDDEAGQSLSLVGERQCLLAVLLRRCGFVVPQTTREGQQYLQNSINPPGEGNRASGVMICRPTGVPPRWRLKNVNSSDLGAFSELFSNVFGQAISPGLWHWKYAEGRGFGVAAWRNNRMVAHYGGTLRAVMAFGQRIRAVQVCDAMVEPRERAVMTKTGVMFQVTAAFLELYQGLGGIPLAFGFPNRRAMRLGERLGHYAEVGELRELRWDALGKSPSLGSRIRMLNPEAPGDQQVIDRLWADMASDLDDAVVGLRDWIFVRHRYVNHPERRYGLILVTSRWTGAPLGLLVLHQEETRLALTDLIAPVKAIPVLVMQARRLAGLWGCTSLYCWISRQNVDRFSTQDMEVLDSGVSIPTNSWVPQPYTPAQLRDRWWLTLGDTDFL